MWSQSANLRIKQVEEICRKYFDEVLNLINTEYGRFFNHIKKELTKINTKISFEYHDRNLVNNTSNQFENVGSTSGNGISVYNIQFNVSNKI